MSFKYARVSHAPPGMGSNLGTLRAILSSSRSEGLSWKFSNAQSKLFSSEEIRGFISCKREQHSTEYRVALTNEAKTHSYIARLSRYLSLGIVDCSSISPPQPSVEVTQTQS